MSATKTCSNLFWNDSDDDDDDDDDDEEGDNDATCNAKFARLRDPEAPQRWQRCTSVS